MNKPPEYEQAFDEDGFLKDPQIWSEAIAQKVAHSSGVERLTRAHWDVINYLRRHYLEHAAIPPQRLVCHDAGLEEECLKRLFGEDLKTPWRIAGLPNPGEEAKTYM